MAGLLRRILKGKQPATEDEYDVAHFAKTFQQIQTAFANPNARNINADALSARLQSLLNALVSEQNEVATYDEAGATGACFEYLLKHQVIHDLIELCFFGDRSRLGHAHGRLILEWLTELVGALDHNFLVHHAAHAPIIRLLQTCYKKAEVGENYELQIVQLMCLVCGRIKAYPDLLIIFFRPHSPATSLEHRVTSPTPSQTDSTTSSATTNRTDFLLFEYLLRFVHREGDIGQLSQAGLLLIIEVAMAAHTSSRFPPAQRMADNTIVLPSSTSPNSLSKVKSSDVALLLSEWLLDSDFGEVLAAGLGALYGLLPSKLTTKSFTLSPLAQSKEEDGGDLDSPGARSKLLGAASLQDPQTLASLRLFRCFAEFIQSVLDRSSQAAKGDREKALMAGALRESLTQAVENIFLTSVTYPSMMESSNQDGSSLAVLVYLKQMLGVFAVEGSLTEVVLQHLMAEDPSGNGAANGHSMSRSNCSGDIMTLEQPTSASKSKIAKRKFSAMLLMESTRSDPYLSANLYSAKGRFNLRDMLLDNLGKRPIQSNNQAALGFAVHELLQVILKQRSATFLELFEARTQLRYNSCLTTLGDGFAPQEQDVRHDGDDHFVYSKHGGSARADSTQKPQSLNAKLSTFTTFLHDLRQIGHLQRVNIHTEESLSLAIAAVTSHDCFWHSTVKRKVSLANRQLWRISPTSTLLHTLLSHLQNFWLNLAEYNLALMGTLLAMASLPLLALSEWVLPRDLCNSFGRGSGNLIAQEDASANVCHILHDLQSQLEEISIRMPSLGNHMASRKASLSFVNDLSDAINHEHDGLPNVSQNRQNAQATRGQSAHRTETNPFSDHFENTHRISVTLSARQDPKSYRARNLDEVSEDSMPTYGMSVYGSSQEAETTTTLSNLLDNIILLGQFSDQMASIIQPVRIAMPCGNPLYVQILTAELDKAKERDPTSYYAKSLAKAIKSIKANRVFLKQSRSNEAYADFKTAVPFEDPKEAQQLNGVGPSTVKLIIRGLKQFEEDGCPLSNGSEELNQQSTRKVTGKTKGKGKEAKYSGNPDDIDSDLDVLDGKKTKAAVQRVRNEQNAAKAAAVLKPKSIESIRVRDTPAHDAFHAAFNQSKSSLQTSKQSLQVPEIGTSKHAILIALYAVVRDCAPEDRLQYTRQGLSATDLAIHAEPYLTSSTSLNPFPRAIRDLLSEGATRSTDGKHCLTRQGLAVAHECASAVDADLLDVESLLGRKIAPTSSQQDALTSSSQPGEASKTMGGKSLLSLTAARSTFSCLANNAAKRARTYAPTLKDNSGSHLDDLPFQFYYVSDSGDRILSTSLAATKEDAGGNTMHKVEFRSAQALHSIARYITDRQRQKTTTPMPIEGATETGFIRKDKLHSTANGYDCLKQTAPKNVTRSAVPSIRPAPQNKPFQKQKADDSLEFPSSSDNEIDQSTRICEEDGDLRIIESAVPTKARSILPKQFENSTTSAPVHPFFTIDRTSSLEVRKSPLQRKAELELSDLAIMHPGEYTIYLCIDNRESKSIKKFDNIPNVKTMTKALSVGDAVWVAVRNVPSANPEDDCIVLDALLERKRLDDLVSSIKSKRYDDQKVRMRLSGFTRLYYLLEDYKSEDFANWDQQMWTVRSQSQVSDGFSIITAETHARVIAIHRQLTNIISELYESQTLYGIRDATTCRRSLLSQLENLRKKHPQISSNILVTLDTFQSMNCKQHTMGSEWAGMMFATPQVSAEKCVGLLQRWPSAAEFWQDISRKRKESDAQLAQDERDGHKRKRKDGTGEAYIMEQVGSEGTRGIKVTLSRQLYELWTLSSY